MKLTDDFFIRDLHKNICDVFVLCPLKIISHQADAWCGQPLQIMKFCGVLGGIHDRSRPGIEDAADSKCAGRMPQVFVPVHLRSAYLRKAQDGRRMIDT